MASEAEKIVGSHTAMVTIEVAAEVIYVLKHVYSIGRDEIKESVLGFLSEVQVDGLVPALVDELLWRSIMDAFALCRVLKRGVSDLTLPF